MTKEIKTTLTKSLRNLVQPSKGMAFTSLTCLKGFTSSCLLKMISIHIFDSISKFQPKLLNLQFCHSHTTVIVIEKWIFKTQYTLCFLALSSHQHFMRPNTKYSIKKEILHSFGTLVFQLDTLFSKRKNKASLIFTC